MLCVDTFTHTHTHNNRHTHTPTATQNKTQYMLDNFVHIFSVRSTIITFIDFAK